MKRSLKEIGEDELVAHLVSGLTQDETVVVGAGSDDCAVVDIGLKDTFQLLKTDTLVERVHYFTDTPSEQVGWKAIARVMSDFAAMGGTPAQFLITLALPSSLSLSYVDGLYRGMNACLARYGGVICGGETSSVPDGSAAVISVAGTGWVDKNRCIRRGGGRVGDAVLVTGKLGGSIEGKHLNFTPRLDKAKWLTEHFSLHAMMDISDGLASDLPRLAKVSACDYHLEYDQIPCSPGCSVDQALSDGEDYELLFTLGKSDIDDLLSAWEKQFPDLPLTVIGELISGSVSSHFHSQRGWQHFRS